MEKTVKTLFLLLPLVLLSACAPQTGPVGEVAWEDTLYPGNHLFSSRPDISYY